jgi:eukaryotic-like serine/threonine-protein kinase
MSAAVSRAQVYRIFSEAMDVATQAREAFVVDRCAGDAQLQLEVTALLAAAAADSGATNVLLGGSLPALKDLVGHEYGRFRLQELIGSGGMGVVYRAVRTDGVPQAVAVKLLRGEITATSSARFVSEARLLARLEHPAVARLIDVGVKDDEGWIALELVRGCPIDEYCEKHQLDIRKRVKLVAVIAGAVASAHRLLVVHRDIKPTNVLVDEQGHPKLIDFGIAATLTGEQGTREPTLDVRRLFTPNYAAPEQVSGDPVSVATDVFSLGALGYRLLSGKAPFAEAASPVGYMLAVTQQDVPAPSRVAITAGTDASRARELRGDLDAILMKALARDPAQRYLSALDLQADLHRYLDGLPVSAHAPSLGYRLRKFVRRRALLVSVTSLLIVGLVAGGVIYGLEARRVAQARDTAARRGEFLQHLLESADPNIGNKDVTVAELLDVAEKELAGHPDDEWMTTASMYQVIAQTNLNLGRHAAGLVAADQAIALLRSHDGPTSSLGLALLVRGNLLRTSGQYPQAETTFREAVACLRGVRGEEQTLAGALSDLGSVLANLDAREPEAEALMRESIAISRTTGDARIGYALSNLAVLLANEGRYAESLPLAKEGVAKLATIVPADHPDLLSLKNTLAGTLVNDHRAAEAEPYFREVAAARLRKLGPEHPDTQFSSLSLADDLAEQHRYAEAAALAGPATAALERIEGPDHPWTLYGLHVFGSSACRSGQGEQGLAALRRAAELRDQRYGLGDWRSISSHLAEASCLVVLRRYAEAEPLLLHAVHEMEQLRGTTFNRTQDGYRSLRDLYTGLGRTDDAARWATRIAP